MLVLTRRPGESIVIGNEVVVTVLEVRHDQVRIGIAAPRSVQVHREEIFRQVAKENASAVTDVDRATALLRRRPPRPPAAGGSTTTPAATPPATPPKP